MSSLGDRFNEVSQRSERRALALNLKYGVTDVNGWQTAAALVGVLAGLGAPETGGLRSVVALAVVLTLALQALPAPWLAGRLGLLEPLPDSGHATADAPGRARHPAPAG